MEQQTVSIVIAVYNGEKFLPMCLESVLRQTWKALDILVVDDGSQDATPELLHAYALQDKRITVIRQSNQGVSNARNAGIKRAKGTYLTFVDADDWIEPEHIERLVTALCSNRTDCAVCGYWIEACKKRECRGIRNDCVLSGGEGIEKMLEPDGIQGFLCNKLFRLSTIRNAGLKLHAELTHYEDVLFCAAYFACVDRVSMIREATYHYRQHDKSAMALFRHDKIWMDGHASALKSLSYVEKLCITGKARRLCKARMGMEYADVFRRSFILSGMTEDTQQWKKKMNQSLWDVACSPLRLKFKVKYISTVLFPKSTAGFWVRREG